MLRANQLFAARLDEVLEEDEFREVLAELLMARIDVDREDIRNDVKDRRQAVLGRVTALLLGLQVAEMNLIESEERLEAKARASVVRVTRLLTVIAGVLVVALLLGVAFVGGDTLALAFVFLLPYAGLPWLLLSVRRNWYASHFSVPIRRQVRNAAEQRLSLALRDQIKVAIWEAINLRLRSFETCFQIFDLRGLRELADPEREVPTKAGEELVQLMTSLSSGSIGLSGPRGSGKTTMIESFAHGRSVPFESERIGMVVSAPVKYTALEFVLHLFASLCQSVLGEGEADGLDDVSRLRRRAWSRILGFVTVLLGLVGGAMVFFDRTLPEGPVETGYMLLGLAGLSLYLWLLTWLASGPNAVSRFIRRFFAALAGEVEDDGDITHERRAQRHLEEIKFQQSISAGWSGSVRLPLGLGLGRESSRSLSRAPWTLPEAVEAFRGFAASLTGIRYLVIGTSSTRWNLTRQPGSSLTTSRACSA